MGAPLLISGNLSSSSSSSLSSHKQQLILLPPTHPNPSHLNQTVFFPHSSLQESGFTMGASCPQSHEGLVGCHAYSILCVRVSW